MEKMTHDYIRQVIPEDISEKGGVRLRLVGNKTVPLETSIKEAKATGCVLGDEELVKRQFEGLVQCMRDGVEADGMARQIDGWVTVYPVFVGPIDLSKGFDPEKNGVRIRMRLLNEIDVDITDWEFRDVTPGRTPFTLDSASTGELVNMVKVGDPVHVNGRPFPPHDALRVDWAVEGTDKNGTIPADKFTSDATLITIAEDALEELASEEYDGKAVVFTVRGNFSSAKISATLKYVPPEPFEITDVRTDGEGGESGRIADGQDFAIVGLGFTDDSVANVRYTRAASGEEEDIYLLGSMIESREPGKIVVGSGFWESIGSSMDKTKKASFYVTESDPSTGEIVRRTNSFDAFVVDA